MVSQVTMRPVDVPVALRLAEEPELSYEALHNDLGISTSTAFQAVARLGAAGIVYPHARKVNRRNLLEFLLHGVKYVFPAEIRGVVKGVPTAFAGPPLADKIAHSMAVVWPDPQGSVIGESVAPLYPGATRLPQRCPGVYEMLTLVDAVRMGRARERKLAGEKLRRRLGQAGAGADA
jgi:hypothetical protein